MKVIFIILLVLIILFAFGSFKLGKKYDNEMNVK